jgi:hypothetical protein
MIQTFCQAQAQLRAPVQTPKAHPREVEAKRTRLGSRRSAALPAHGEKPSPHDWLRPPPFQFHPRGKISIRARIAISVRTASPLSIKPPRATPASAPAASPPSALLGAAWSRAPRGR